MLHHPQNKFHAHPTKPTMNSNCSPSLPLLFLTINDMKLTGSAKMTTSTVALPGVSRLTNGVSIVHPLSLTAFSIPGSYNQCNNSV